ncbi:hypothetical protein I4U23_013136 [Adineta vaga]|nr:hypothetical protein I4U23_013136 [Adineta vaga]
MFFIGISIPFVGILLVIFFGLSNTRNILVHQLLIKLKKPQSLQYTTNNHSSTSYLAIPMTSIPLDDDEDLMKYDLSSKFSETTSIELRLEQDLDSDNDIIDN